MIRSSLLPPKYFESVSTESAEAPACMYPIEVRSTDTYGLITPFDGDLRLISAIIPDLSGRVTYFFKDTVGPSK